MRPRSEQPVGILILRDLADGPATVKELEEAIGVHRRNLRAYLKMLHDEKQIHIAGWEQRQGPALPIWGAGNFPDKRRPRRKNP